MIAERLGPLVASGQGHRILNAHYTGTLALVQSTFPSRFFNAIGATEIEPDTICNLAGHEALGLVYGASEIGFDPRTARDSRCIVVWGANPCRRGPHPHEHWLAENDATVVVIDPIRTRTAARPTSTCSRVRERTRRSPSPSSTYLYATVSIDRAFVDANTVGYDELEPVVAPCSPGWAEGVDGGAGGRYRARRRAVRARPVPALARAGPSAAAPRRCDLPRLLAAPGRQREPRPARCRLHVHEHGGGIGVDYGYGCPAPVSPPPTRPTRSATWT